ncbi:MAG: hypothetical protein AB8C95_10885, partial [Phycisphaeraceae bacterium]
MSSQHARPNAKQAVRFALLYPVLAVLLIAAVGPITGLYAQDQAEPVQPPVIIECPGPAGHGQPGPPPFAQGPGQPVQLQAQAQEKPKQPDLTEQLGGEDRYLTHLATDKPIYRAEETVYVRGTILHAFTQKPIDDKKEEIEALNEQINVLQQANKPENRPALNELYRKRSMLQREARLSPMVEIKDPKGATVVSGRTDIQDSTLGFKWEVPEGQAGGEYTVKVSYPWSGLAPAERTFDIRAYRAPRIKTQIDFLKDGYGPGDTVIATIDVTRAEGGIPEGAKVTAIARVDGSEVARVSTMVRETGVAEVRFDLPDKIERGEGSLTFVIEDGGVVESASKTLPILLQTLDLQFFPEGGELIAGVENRVYFEAKTPFGKPADIKGVITKRLRLDAVDAGFIWPLMLGTEFETTHEGRGVFTFTPEPGEHYAIQITEPSSVTQTFELPAVGHNSIAVQFERAVYAHEDFIAFEVHNTHPRVPDIDNPNTDPVTIQVRQREVIVGSQTVYPARPGTARAVFFAGDAGGRDVSLGQILSDTATGILTVTAYDADGKPLAERLIYRAPKNQVNIEIMP